MTRHTDAAHTDKLVAHAARLCAECTCTHQHVSLLLLTRCIGRSFVLPHALQLLLSCCCSCSLLLQLRRFSCKSTLLHYLAILRLHLDKFLRLHHFADRASGRGSLPFPAQVQSVLCKASKYRAWKAAVKHNQGCRWLGIMLNKPANKTGCRVCEAQNCTSAWKRSSAWLLK